LENEWTTVEYHSANELPDDLLTADYIMNDYNPLYFQWGKDDCIDYYKAKYGTDIQALRDYLARANTQFRFKRINNV